MAIVLMDDHHTTPKPPDATRSRRRHASFATAAAAVESHEAATELEEAEACELEDAAATRVEMEQTEVALGVVPGDGMDAVAAEADTAQATSVGASATEADGGHRELADAARPPLTVSLDAGPTRASRLSSGHVTAHSTEIAASNVMPVGVPLIVTTARRVGMCLITFLLSGVGWFVARTLQILPLEWMSVLCIHLSHGVGLVLVARFCASYRVRVLGGRSIPALPCRASMRAAAGSCMAAAAMSSPAAINDSDRSSMGGRASSFVADATSLDPLPSVSAEGGTNEARHATWVPKQAHRQLAVTAPQPPPPPGLGTAHSAPSSAVQSPPPPIMKRRQTSG